MDFQFSKSLSEGVFEVKETTTFTKNKDLEGRSKVNEYIFGNKLGEGTFGKVKLVMNGEHQKKYAVKILKKDALKRKKEMIRDERGRMKYKTALEDVMREIAIMKKLNHPNLIKLYEVIDNPESAKMYLIMEYAAKGQMLEWDQENRIFHNLHQQEHIEEDSLRKIFAEAIQGLYYLHLQGVIHRDLKPQNILHTSDGTTKIADFGVSDIVGDTDILTKTAGTYHFMAPECVTIKNGGSGFSGKAADVWALGATFYSFVFYRPPFDGEDTLDLFEKIETRELRFPEYRVISDELKDLLTRMLEKNPGKRITLNELMNHNWFQKSKTSQDLAVKCSTMTEKVTVSKEEIQNACTSFEKVVFMKRVAKKMLGKIRKGHLAMQDQNRNAKSLSEISE